MSVVLSVYSQSAYKEFVLPAIHNAETVLVIDRRVFHLQILLERYAYSEIVGTFILI